MRVSEDGSAEDSIHNRIESPGSEWCYRQRYQSGGYKSIEPPSARIKLSRKGVRTSQKPNGSSRGWAKDGVQEPDHWLGFLSIFWASIVS